MDGKYRIQFNDGTFALVDERIVKIINDLQKAAKSNSGMPGFFDLGNNIKSLDEDLLNFYVYLLKNRKNSRSQLFQDIFVCFKLGEKEKGAFLEFGATNGVELSNSLLLEQQFGWRGVLAEPSPQWHEALKQNRPDATIITDCIYWETGKTADFFVSEFGVLSSLEAFKNHDAASMPANAQARNRNGYTAKVPTISLNDVFVKYFESAPIDYMSVDTEGSELLILESFDFGSFGPKIVTVEHNFSDSQAKLDDLFQRNGYRRYFREQTQFDAWYVRQE